MSELINGEVIEICADCCKWFIEEMPGFEDDLFIGPEAIIGPCCVHKHYIMLDGPALDMDGSYLEIPEPDISDILLSLQGE